MNKFKGIPSKFYLLPDSKSLKLKIMASVFLFSAFSSSPLQRHFIFLPLIICLQLYTAPIMAQFFPHAVCSTGNFTTNSTYQTTLTSLFSSISSLNNLSYNFFNNSLTTQTNETVSAIGFCRSDVPSHQCREFLQTSASDIRKLCPNQKEAIVWNEGNTFRYSNRSIGNNVEADPYYQLSNTQSASNQDQFNAALQSLLMKIRPEAAVGGPLRKFAASNSSAGFQTIYGLVQCTPDLSEQQCNDCLFTIIGRIPTCCEGKIGGRVLAPSCYLHFEISRFFNDPAEALPSPTTPPVTVDAPPPSPPTPPPPGKSSATVIIVVVISVTSAIGVIPIICILWRKKKKPKQRVENEDTGEISTPESLQFDLQTVRAATDGFSNEKMLGQGGFGAVFKGVLPNGLEIAVKRLATNSGQGELEFKNEVMLLARLQHRNLVRLLGFCLEGIERLLIYEYVPNSSLDNFIFDPVKRGLLEWEKRYKIIHGIARGLLYLHEDSRLRIIHRDMKASNVLLDESMNPKIADFGMARLFAQDQTRADTNRIVGTFGYMSPEYAIRGNFSVKSDVYSFGVMVLEIVSGQKSNCFLNEERSEVLITWAWRNWREGTIENIIDPCLVSGSRSAMTRCIHIGLLCVQENVVDRPTMASVYLMLSSHSTSLQVLLPSSKGGNQNENKSEHFSYNDVTVTDPYPR